MYWSKFFIPTLKEAPQEAESVSHTLMLRAGLVRMLAGGVYTYLPLGLRVLNAIETIIREEMERAGAAELLLPALQPLELWEKTGRDKTIGEVMIRFQDRRGRKLCLGPTHEEVITDLVAHHVSSYRHLPLLLYQIQTKFRDEIRPRYAVIRSCEFVMKDAYSFDRDGEGLKKSYAAMYDAYTRIFKRCGLHTVSIEADSGVMGGSVSHEFMVPAEIGEDAVLTCAACSFSGAFSETLKTCPRCGGGLAKTNTIEIGHIFQLGTKYSATLGAQFLDEKGQLQPVIMGCYGIGVSRLIAAVIEQNHDQAGIIWPQQVSPFQVQILPLNVTDAASMQAAGELYAALTARGIAVLLDDRDERAGVKFKDAELIGIPHCIVIGPKSIAQGAYELKLRRQKSTEMVPREMILRKIEALRESAFSQG